MSVLCELRGATLGYGSQVVLAGVDLAVVAGDFIVIGGPNGGGKSTLLKTIARLIPPLCGSVSGRARFGYVPQIAAIEPALPVTAFELVALGAAAAQPWWRTVGAGARDLARRCLDECHAGEFARKPFAALSGGQRQRVLLARALATRATCLLLDEPTAGVDRVTQTALAGRLGELAGTQGLGVILVTHEAEPFTPIASRFLRVEEGRVSDAGPLT